MTFARVLLGWAAVLLLFAVWGAAERRIRVTPDPALAALRSALGPIAIEAALLTLFAGLWFSSLGSGGALTLFLVVGALMEIPSRLRHRGEGPLAWKPMLGGVTRIVLAGLLLAFVMQ